VREQVFHGRELIPLNCRDQRVGLVGFRSQFQLVLHFRQVAGLGSLAQRTVHVSFRDRDTRRKHRERNGQSA
jgi:hypothetical protein